MPRRLAREGGPDAIVLRAVSREAGVSHSAAYRHFADHDDLLATTAQRCPGALGELMEERLAGVTVADPVGTTRAAARGDRSGVRRLRGRGAGMVPHRVHHGRAPRVAACVPRR